MVNMNFIISIFIVFINNIPGIYTEHMETRSWQSRKYMHVDLLSEHRGSVLHAVAVATTTAISN